MVGNPETVDDLDKKILELLGVDARQTALALADEVKVSSTAVRRRIARMEDDGVIVGYTVVRDHTKLPPSLEAYVELDFVPGADVQKHLEAVVAESDVREASMLAGHPDAIVRLRVANIQELRKTVTRLRATDEIQDTKILVSLKRYRHVSQHRQNHSS
jgi:Lrp/AsnC family transcriptional regulator, leucine-responsive regulatory protein